MQHILALSIAFFLLPSLAQAASDYYRHVIFDNSLTSDSYFYSNGQASGQSFIEQQNGRLPVESKIFLTPPNAMRLQWQSAQEGGWVAEITTVAFRNRYPELSGNNLYFWIYSPQPISAADMPKIVISNAREGLQIAEFPGNFSEPLDLGKYTGDVPAGRWVKVRIPLSDCRTASVYPLKPEYIQNVIFHQGRADNVRHTLIVDGMRIGDDLTDASTPPPPSNLRAVGFDRHVELEWDAVGSKALTRYVIYRSLDDKNFTPIGIQLPGIHRYEDFLGKAGVHAEYKIAASNWQYRQSAFSNVSSASTHELTDDELLTMLQKACFHYYWEGADPHSGMTFESIPGDERMVATGASGFGLWHLWWASIAVSSRANRVCNG